jgi:hypothetical protein
MEIAAEQYNRTSRAPAPAEERRVEMPEQQQKCAWRLDVELKAGQLPRPTDDSSTRTRGMNADANSVLKCGCNGKWNDAAESSCLKDCNDRVDFKLRVEKLRLQKIDFSEKKVANQHWK